MRITEQHVFRHRQDPYCLHLKTQLGVHRVTPWRADLACHQWRDGAWREVRQDPGFILLSRGNDVSFHKTLTAFLEPIPAKFRDAVSRFGFMQFTALRLLRLYPGGVDMAEDNPALFWLCCGRLGRGSLSPARAVELLTWPRKLLISELLGQDCVFTDHFFRKIRLRTFNAAEYDHLERMLTLERTSRGFRHLEMVDPAVACLAYENGEKILSDGLIQDLSFGCNLERVQEAKQAVRDILAMGEELGLRKILAGRVRKLRDYFELAYLHDDTLAEYNATVHEKNVADLKDAYGETFPTPLLAGNENIEPIRSLPELEEEGTVMKHCALLYARRIFEGRLCLYRVHLPERATLAIHMDDSGEIHIADFALRRNHRPCAETQRVVGEWIKTAKRNWPQGRRDSEEESPDPFSRAV
jgi:hypothetical protein